MHLHKVMPLFKNTHTSSVLLFFRNLSGINTINIFTILLNFITIFDYRMTGNTPSYYSTILN